MSRKNDIKKILMKGENYFVCKHCGMEYVAFTELAATFCVKCQKKEASDFLDTLAYVNFVEDSEDYDFGLTD